ncbi:hypothetical protein [Kitasatospora sp. NBC_00458]|uniref:hypothetical protein n=1 Tax=Kitasatospora sp. NBC_00458 TaxID=2903568 RepID=UPI002E179E13
MERARRRRGVRVAASLGGLVCLGATLFVVWLLPGQRMAATLGIGAVDGRVVVDECFRTSDFEGGGDGVECDGRFVPAGGSEVGRRVRLREAGGLHPAGSRVEVRLAGGDAFEESIGASVEFAGLAGILLALGGAGVGWCFDTARRGEAGSDGWMIVFCFGPIAAAVLGVPLVLVLALLVKLF